MPTYITGDDDVLMTPEARARELLDRLGMPGALEMSAGDVAEVAELIAAADSRADGWREAFEAFFAHARGGRGRRHRPTFDRLPDGTYADESTQRHWWTWQNALKAARGAGQAGG